MMTWLGRACSMCPAWFSPPRSCAGIAPGFAPTCAGNREVGQGADRGAQGCAGETASTSESRRKQMPAEQPVARKRLERVRGRRRDATTRCTLSTRTGIWLPIESFIFVIKGYFCQISNRTDPYDINTVEVLAFPILDRPHHLGISTMSG